MSHGDSFIAIHYSLLQHIMASAGAALLHLYLVEQYCKRERQAELLVRDESTEQDTCVSWLLVTERDCFDLL